MRAALVATLAAAMDLLPATSVAGPPSLAFPLDCTLGRTCFIQQYVDRDPTPGSRDYTCGSLTYDGHKGTDIRVATVQEIFGHGIIVRASAAGKVVGTRNTMPDIAQGDANAPDIKGRECGNGVVIDHGGGWRTQYCHMRRGSVNVSKGQTVAQGEELGRIGLSGETEFPHLHIKLSKNGKTIDPFDIQGAKGCNPANKPQAWQSAIPYQAGGLLAAGFSDKAPSYASVKTGLPDLTGLPNDAPALVVWGMAYGLRKNDTFSLQLYSSDGREMAAQSYLIRKNRAVEYRLLGKRRNRNLWPAGTYNATLKIIRDGVPIDSRNLEIEVGNRSKNESGRNGFGQCKNGSD